MIRGILALTLLVICMACGRTSQEFKGAPVILISIDTLRSDRLPAYGYTGVDTPALDAFAADSVVFDHAYSQYPLTLPSHASMFTGLIPPNVGVRNNAGFALEDRFDTLPEILGANGYQTGGVISSMVLKQSTGMAQGFDYFDDGLQFSGANRIRVFAQRRGDASVASAQQWLSGLDDGPFFLFLHLYDPHTPYEAPEPYGSRYASSPYDGEIAYTDSLLSGFFADLKRRGLYDQSLIVVLSDHGEGLGDHGEEEHGVLLYRESIQVPLMVKFPGNARAGERVSQAVGLMDIKPSILNTIGLDAPDTDGVDIFGGQPPSGRNIYSETLYPYYQFGWCSSKSVVRDDLHYIEICEPELYNLITDPAERNDLYGSRAVPRPMINLLRDLGEGLATTTETSQEDLEMLNSLGYGGAVGVDQENVLDPKTQLAVFKELDQAKILLEEKKYVEAEELLLPILERNRALNDGRYLLIQALVEQGKYEAAQTVCLDGLGMFPDNENYLISMTRIQYFLNDPEEAERVAARAFAKNLDTAGAQLLMPLYENGAEAKAVAYAQSILERFTETSLSAPYANLVMGRHYREQKQYQASLPFLERAVTMVDNIRQDRTRVQLYLALGDSYGRLGQEAKALEWVKKAHAIEPSFSESNATLSYLYASMRDPNRAIGVIENWLKEYPTRANFIRAAEVVERMGMKTRGSRYRAEAEKIPAK